MEINQLRKEMEGLWKETFGDSSEYISLVFGQYFNPATVAYHEEDGRLLSALLGVPYEFASAEGVRLKGLYLCGLATRRDARRHGIMSGLLEEINERAQNEGYDFTFLIPSGGGVKRYYYDHGYHESFYKIKERYVKGHNFGAQEGIDVWQYDGGSREEVLAFLESAQPEAREGKLSFSLCHTREAWIAVLEEAELSKEYAYIAEREGRIEGIAFTCHKEEGEKRETLEVKKIIATDRAVERTLLAKLSEMYSESSIAVVRNLEEVVDSAPDQLWSPFFARNNGQKAEYEDIAEIERPFNISRLAYPFGMVRIFNLKELLSKAGVDNTDTLKGFSKQELFRLVLRRPVGNQSDALENILDLPELSLTMSLLLE